MDWATAAGSTLASAVVDNFGAKDSAAAQLSGKLLNGSLRLGTDLLVAGALKQYDKNAAKSYFDSSVGQEVGQFIGDYIGQKLAPYLPKKTGLVFDPNRNTFVDQGTGHAYDKETGSFGSASSTAMQGGGGSNATAPMEENTTVRVFQKDDSGGVYVDQYGNPAPLMYADSGQIAADANVNGVGPTPNAGQAPVTEDYKLKQGDNLWNIAKGQLPAGATDADIQKQVYALMEVNPGVDPRGLQIGSNITLVSPNSGIAVSDATVAGYRESDAEYQQYRAEQARIAAEANAPSSEAASVQPQAAPTTAAASTPAQMGATGDSHASETESFKFSDLLDAIKNGIKLGNAAYAQSEGFDVKIDAEGKARVYGSQAANEALELKKNFRISDVTNEDLLRAKGFDPNVGRGILEDLKPTKLGGALTLLGLGLDVAEATSQYRENGDKAAYAGNLGNAVTRTAVTTAGTALVIAGGVALAGAATIAAAPVVVTVGASIAIGVGVNYVYDRFAKESVTSFFSNAYNQFTK